MSVVTTSISQGIGFLLGSVIGIGIGFNAAFVGGAVANWVFLFVYWAICGTGDLIDRKQYEQQSTKRLDDDVEAFQANARPTLSCKSD